MTIIKKHRALIVNPILFHYRRGVFRQLDINTDFDFVFAADLGPRNGIECMDPCEVSNFKRIQARRLWKIEWYSGLVGLLHKEKFDSVIFLGDAKVLSTWIASIYARSRGVRVFFWTIGWHRPESGLKKHLRLAFYGLADTLLLYGKVGLQIGKELGFDVNRIHVIGNSVETSFRGPKNEVLDLPLKNDGVLWLGAVIRLTAVKRLDLLLRAVKLLNERGIETRVLLVGEGPDTEDLRLLAAELAIPVHFVGAAYSEQTIEKVYDLLDITVVPSAVGLTAIQSLSYGVPVISDNSPFTQMPEWEAIVPGKTGDLYASGEVDDLARAVLRVYDRLLSSQEEVSAMCKYEIQARWTPERQASRIANAIAESRP